MDPPPALQSRAAAPGTRSDFRYMETRATNQTSKLETYYDIAFLTEELPAYPIRYRIRQCISHTPGALSKLDSSATKRVPIPNDTSSESPWRDIFNADLYGAGTIPTVEISTMENRPKGVLFAPSYTVTTIVLAIRQCAIPSSTVITPNHSPKKENQGKPKQKKAYAQDLTPFRTYFRLNLLSTSITVLAPPSHHTLLCLLS